MTARDLGTAGELGHPVRMGAGRAKHPLPVPVPALNMPAFCGIN